MSRFLIRDLLPDDGEVVGLLALILLIGPPPPGSQSAANGSLSTSRTVGLITRRR
ncbi:hypothetical protein [Nonomuraea jabiensis]|uniref:hypothetical protein n=1 Tax=Nonomuraea jabiensis TaxID=882448 RepID=UPI00368A502D